MSLAQALQSVPNVSQDTLLSFKATLQFAHLVRLRVVLVSRVNRLHACLVVLDFISLIPLVYSVPLTVSVVQLQVALLVSMAIS